MNLYLLALCTILMHSCRLKQSYSVESGLVDVYENVKCFLGYCCNKYWIPNNITQLQEMLYLEVFGQHIAIDIIKTRIASHLSNANPSKPLVMSFHGGPGIGKTHVTSLIAKSIYKTGISSPFFHHFLATTHFPHKTQEHTDRYHDQISTWIKGNVSICPQSLFVFDEVDKMSSGVLNSLTAYLDNVEKIDKQDYRRSIFIFLSNKGGTDINNITINKIFTEKVKRENLKLRDFGEMVKHGAFNEIGGLQKSFAIEKGLIDAYVPFLPLEKFHVRMCAEKEFRKQNFYPSNTETALEKIVEEQLYFPEDNEFFSKSGCRGVAENVRLYINGQKGFHPDEL